jgi:hypothetical protein
VPYKSVDELYARWDGDKPYLSSAEIQALIGLLKQASEEFSNNGCNDHPLKNTDENWKLYLRYLDFVDEEDDDEDRVRPPKRTALCFYDWLLCDYFVSKLKGMK